MEKVYRGLHFVLLIIGRILLKGKSLIRLRNSWLGYSDRLIFFKSFGERVPVGLR